MAAPSSFSDNISGDEDEICTTVDHFSSIFANIRRQEENKLKIQTESIKVIKESERKSAEGKSSKKKASANDSSKKEVSKEAMRQKIQEEMEAKKDLDELLLLDDLDDILLDKTKKISPKRQLDSEVITEIKAISIDELPSKKAKQPKRQGKKGRKSDPEIANVPVPVIDDVDLVDDEDVLNISTPLQPAKYASVHVTWREKTFMISVNLYDKVSLLRQEISRRAETRAEDILIYFGEENLEDDKTLLESGVNRGNTLEAMKCVQANLDPAMLKLKCQTTNRRQTFHVHIRKATPLRQLRDDVAVKLGVSPESVKLHFDGEMLDLDETPESMELENGYCIDVYTN